MKLPLHRRRAVRIALVLVTYLVSFVVLDWWSRGFQVFPGVVAWYPPDGLSFALLLTLGTRFAPILGIASLISSFFIYQLSIPPLQLFGWAVLISITFGISSMILQRAKIDLQLRSLRDVLWLILSAAVISILLAVVSISGGTASGDLSTSQRTSAIFQWWVGEMIGILVITPMLLIFVMPWAKRFAEGGPDLSWKPISLPRAPRNMLARVIALLIILYLSFGLPDLRPFHPYYLVAIPLLWLALDHGIKGAVLGIPFINFGITFLVGALRFSQTEITELQLLMLVISAVGLVVGAVRTEQIQAGKEVHYSENRFKALIENSADAITLLDAEGVALYDSPAAPGMLGYTKDELVGRRVFDLIHADDLRATQVLFQNLTKSSGSRIDHTFRFLHKDGSWRWIEAVATNLLDEPSVKAIVVNYRNITERRQAEESLRSSEDRYRDLVDNSQDLVCTHDLEGRILSVNPYTEQVLGYPTGGLLQMNLRDILTSDAQKYFERYLSNIRKHGIAKGTMMVKTTRGETRIWQYRNTLRTEGVAMPIVRGMARDITEQKQAEESTRLRTDELSRLYELSRALANANDLSQILELVNRHAVESVHCTSARIALLEGPNFVIRSAYPIRVLDHDLRVGSRLPLASMPSLQSAMEGDAPVLLANDNLPTNQDERESLLLDSLQSLFLIPLRMESSGLYSGLALGLLMLGEARSATREPFSPEKVRLAQSIADQAAVAIRRTLLQEQTGRRLQQILALREIDRAIASSTGLEVSLRTVLRHVTNQLGVDAASILIFDAPSNSLTYATGRGFRTNAFARSTELHIGEGNAGRAILERRTVYIPNLAAEDGNPRLEKTLHQEGFVCYYGVPLIAKGEIKGVLEIFHRAPLEPDQEWLDFMHTLAGQAAIAIDSAQLFGDLQRANAELEQRVAARTAELNQLNLELEHANNAKDEFLASMSHELRTPLNSILGMSELLLEQTRDPLSGYQQQSLEVIASSGRHLLDLINDILDLSKIEAGKFDSYPEIVGVGEVIQSSLAFVKTQAMEKSIDITYEEDKTVSKLYADPRRLKQILVNLLTNAVKFTPKCGQITLQVNANAAEDLIQFSIIDNGIGIAPEDLNRLFQPFVQVDSHLNRQNEGTGLGLALVQKLTDLHGGSVQVESAVGRGSRFTIKLPWGRKILAQSQGSEPRDELLIERQTEKNNLQKEVSVHPAVILLAEDNMANVITIGDYLESHDHQIVVAHNGLEAIEKAEENNPSIILMDIQMPGMDGLEAMRRLRRNPRFAATPIIALTALAMPGDRERCLEAGANEYMSKPVGLKKLLHAINELHGQER